MKIDRLGNALVIDDAGRRIVVESDTSTIEFLHNQLTTRGIAVVPPPNNAVASQVANRDEDYLPLPTMKWEDPPKEQPGEKLPLPRMA